MHLIKSDIGKEKKNNSNGSSLIYIVWQKLNKFIKQFQVALPTMRKGLMYECVVLLSRYKLYKKLSN